MATLNQFPARIAFVDSEGRLTPEAYRALQGIFTSIGNQGTQVGDVFSDVMSSSSADTGYQAEIIMQGES